MKGKNLVALTIVAAALAACGARAGSLEHGTPAVHELARLQTRGLLDAERLGCVTEALRPVTQSLPTRLAELREARAEAAVIPMSDHAAAVQQGMLAAEVASAAARQRASDLRHVTFLESQGLRDEAASLRWYSADAADRVRKMALIAPGPPGSQEPWTEEEGRLLAEYSDLMAERPDDVDDASRISRRIAEIQESHPQVMEGYAAMLLTMYQAPDVQCEASG